jgi:hypothetical protein
MTGTRARYGPLARSSARHRVFVGTQRGKCQQDRANTRRRLT